MFISLNPSCDQKITSNIVYISTDDDDIMARARVHFRYATWTRFPLVPTAHLRVKLGGSNGARFFFALLLLKPKRLQYEGASAREEKLNCLLAHTHKIEGIFIICSVPAIRERRNLFWTVRINWFAGFEKKMLKKKCSCASPIAYAQRSRDKNRIGKNAYVPSIIQLSLLNNKVTHEAFVT